MVKYNGTRATATVASVDMRQLARSDKSQKQKTKIAVDILLGRCTPTNLTGKQVAALCGVDASGVSRGLHA